MLNHCAERMIRAPLSSASECLVLARDEAGNEGQKQETDAVSGVKRKFTSSKFEAVIKRGEQK